MAKKKPSNENPNEALKAITIRWIKIEMILEGFQSVDFTSDAIHARLTIPEGVHHSVMGSTFREMSAMGIIVKVGQTRKTTRRVAKSRDLAVWRLVKHQEAADLLAMLKSNHVPD